MQAAAEELPQKPAPRIDTNQFGIKTWKRIIKQVCFPVDMKE